VSTLVRHWWGWVRHMARPVTLFGGGPDVLLPYMDRYTLRRQKDSGANPWRLYLHNILAGDSLGHHNHPSTWSFSVVLWGSYTEEVLVWDDISAQRYNSPPVVVSRTVRWWNWIPSSKYHRITELHTGPGARGVWTLFVCGPLRRDAKGAALGWGFWRAGVGHVPHTAMEHTKVREEQK
jgi:hypothetical protein